MIAVRLAMQRKTGVGQLRRGKMRTFKRLRAVNDPKNRDLAESGYGKRHIEQIYEKAKKVAAVEDAKLFSKAESISERFPVLHIDKSVYNKEMKKELNKRLDESGKQFILVELANPEYMMSPRADQINRITAEEWEKYKRVFYEKAETKRLLAKKDKDQDEILAKLPQYDGNIEFVKNFVNNLHDNVYHGPDTNTVKVAPVNLLPHENYKKELRSLKNDKIDGLLGIHSANDKLRQLMQAGFMDKSKSITEVFTILQRAQALENPNIADAKALTSDAVDLQPKSLMSPEERAELWRDFSAIIAENPVTAGAMHLVTQAVTKKGLQGEYGADYLGLVEFVKDFVTTDEQEKKEVFERMERVSSLRQYEEGVLQAREQFMLEKRGTPLFSKLQPEERIAYVKHNLNHMQDIFKLVKTEEAVLKEDPKLSLALVEKLALSNTLGALLYKDTKFLDLKAIAQPEYLTLLKTVKDILPELNFEELNRTLFVLGNIHKREVGELSGELYKLTLDRAIVSMSAKLQNFREFQNSQSDASGYGDVVSTSLYHLGIGLQGLLSLGCINNSAPAAFIEQVLDVVQQNIGGVREACTANRFLAFLNQSKSSFGVAYETEIVRVSDALLAHVNKTGVIARMGRPDLLAFTENLIAMIGTDSTALVPACEQLKACILKEDNAKFLSLNDLNELLVLFVGTSTLDVKSKNEIKKKIRHELDLSSNIMSYVIPQSMENLAVSDLKESNPFYKEYANPEDLVLVKNVFGIRPFEFDNSPKFDLYRDMYKLAISYPEQLNKLDFARMIDSLCLLEVPLEVFQYATLEKSIEEMIENSIKQGRPFDAKLACRTCLLFGNVGIYNIRDKWVKLCMAFFKEATFFPTNSLLDLLTSLDGELAQHYEEEVLMGLIDKLLSKIDQLTDQKKVLLAWNIQRLGLDDDSNSLIERITDNINERNLKCLDKLLLSQIPSASSVTSSFSKKDLVELYKFVHHKSSTALSNDTSSIYSAIEVDLKAANQPFKESQWITEAGQNAYTPLYVVKKKTSVHIYPDDLFMFELEMSQNAYQGFEYKLQRTDKLPAFFEMNEENLLAMGIKILRHNARDARKIYVESDLESRLKNEFKSPTPPQASSPSRLQRPTSGDQALLAAQPGIQQPQEVLDQKPKRPRRPSRARSPAAAGKPQ